MPLTIPLGLRLFLNGCFIRRLFVFFNIVECDLPSIFLFKGEDSTLMAIFILISQNLFQLD